MKKLEDFKVGQVYKMKAASRSHVTKPYYVIISEVGDDFITTNIPSEHSLTIKYPSEEWEYHIPRMVRKGSNEKHKQLLLNQNF